MSELAEEMLLDFVNAVEAGIMEVKQRYKERKNLAENGDGWDPSKIKWRLAQGTAGPYERSEDTDSPDFKQLIKDLAENGNKLAKNGYFYWLFNDGSAVGRKKRN